MGASVSEAKRSPEWPEAVERLAEQPLRPGQTVAADKGYEVSRFVAPCRELGVTPPVAQRQYRRLDGRTTRHEGYAISPHKRQRVEPPFGWMKTFGRLHKLRHRGRDNVAWRFRLTATACNITRMKALMA